MKYGYIRHATYAKSKIKQLTGIEVDEVFTDEGEVSDDVWPWPQLQELLDMIQEGDTVYVKSLDRMSRNVSDVANITSQFIEAKATLHITDTGVQISNEGAEILSVLNMLKSLENAISKEVKEETKPGPKPQLSSSQVAEIKRRAVNGEMISKLAREFNISRAILYQKYGIKRK